MGRERSFARCLVAPDEETGEIKPLINQLTPVEEQQMYNMLHRLDLLARTAKDLDVRLMIDAEQTYFQPAISRLAMEMMKVFNIENPNVRPRRGRMLKRHFGRKESRYNGRFS